jgi:dihydroorotate dehydrogenase (fumarate)
MVMVDLRTQWLGLELPTPLVVGACPLTDDMDALVTCVRGGASAVVMRSLFEEQLNAEQMAAHRFLDALADGGAEAQGFLPASQLFELGAEPYLKKLRRLRAHLGVPIIGSLNGTTPGGWLDLARALEGAGAAALELNLYEVATAFEVAGDEIEARQLEVVRRVAAAVTIPVSVKLSPFYSSLPAFTAALTAAGARGVVLFNRFYQPDIDLEALDVSREVRLSTHSELPLRLHALALLSGRSPLALSASGGVLSGDDAAKAVLSGAHVVQVVSALLRHGPHRLAGIRGELCSRFERLGYPSVDDARGVLSLERAPDPRAWERLHYMQLLTGWRPRANAVA